MRSDSSLWGNNAKIVPKGQFWEAYMDQKDIEYFRKLLTSMLEEAKQKGDSTIEELTDSNEVFADPADRATAESDRAFTLRIRDRERRLIRKIQSALQRIVFATNAAKRSPSPVSRPVRSPVCASTARPSRKRTSICAATSTHP